MKRISFLLGLLILFAFGLSIEPILANNNDIAGSNLFSRKSKRPTFAVIGDTHVGQIDNNEKLKHTLDVLVKRQPNLDGVFVLGDMTLTGSKEEYEQVKEIFSTLPKHIQVYYVMGNRERINDHPAPEGQTQFEKILEQPLNHFVDLKGYPCIILNTQTNVEPYYSSTDKEYLEKALVAVRKQYPKKPIFLFCHVPAENTVYGSGIDEGWGSKELVSILKDYPQVVVFSAHSHYPISDERSIHQQYFTSVNVGSTAFIEVEGGYSEGTRPPYFDQVAEAAIVEISKNQDLGITRIDALRGNTIKNNWIIKNPINRRAFNLAKRVDNSNPEFAMDANITITKVEDHKCTVKFPQAIDDDMVHHYVLDVIQESDNKVYQRYTILSQFYLNKAMPQKLHWEATGLKGDTQYKIRIVALDSSGNASQPISSDYFHTPAFTPSSAYTAPKADVLDLVFNDYTGLDYSTEPNNIIYSDTEPNTRFDETLNCYVADFKKDANLFYRIPYSSKKWAEKIQKGFTIELFYKSNELHSAIPMGSMNGKGFGIEQSKLGEPQLSVYMGDGYKSVGDFVATSKTYNHYVFTYDGNELRAYTNGIPTGVTETSGLISLPTEYKAHWLGIGGDANISNVVSKPLSGSIAYIRIYGHSICRDEAYHLYDLMRSRINLRNMQEFNQLLTFAIPRRIDESPKEERKAKLNILMKKGWQLMTNHNTTQKEINDFIHEVKISF